jgi:hypothetical protein
MDPQLQKNFENYNTFDMIGSLKAMYETQARAERYEITKALWQCKMVEGSSVNELIIKMVVYSQILAALGFPIPDSLGTDVLLASPPCLMEVL